MAGSNPINERLVNFRVYDADNNDLLGIATVDLPEISAMTDTVSGAGIAGEIDSPVLGHYGSMTTTLHWRTIEKGAAALASPGSHQIDLRGSQQSYDAATGTYKTTAVRCTMAVIPKGFTLGSFEPGSSTDSEQEFEVVYIKLYVGGKEVLEIDKYNFIARFGGTDALETVRTDLGLA